MRLDGGELRKNEKLIDEMWDAVCLGVAGEEVVKITLETGEEDV